MTLLFHVLLAANKPLLEGRELFPKWSEYDFIIFPFLIILLPTIAYLFKNYKINKGLEYYKYFMPFILLKMFSGFFIAMVYVYYYKYGDSFMYWSNACLLGKKLFANPGLLKYVLVSDGLELNKTLLSSYNSPYMYREQNLTTVKFYAFILPFVNYSYFSATVLFSFISSFGTWKIYRAFMELFPTLKKELAFTTLFIPSCLLWGSGILKDTLTFAGLGWMFWALTMLLIKNKYSVFYFVELIVAVFTVFIIKKYIIIVFVPAFLFLFIYYKSKYVNNKFAKILLYVLLMVLSVLGIILMYSQISEMLGRFALDAIVETALTLNNTLAGRDYADSTFNLGITLDPSYAGLAKAFPFAVFATLFRPFLWEAGNIVALFSALESFGFLVATLYVIKKVTFRKFVKNILTNGVVQFCMIFTILFSFSIGLSTSNFGSLVRYKIPMMPFYLTGLLVIYYNEILSKKTKTK